MKQESTQPLFFSRHLPQACSSLSTWSPVVPFFWVFYAYPSFLHPVYMQKLQTPGILPSDFSPTSITSFTILFISLIYSFLTLQLSLCSLLTQPSSTAINILRNFAPHKNVWAFTTSKSITDSNSNHGLAVQDSSITLHCSSGTGHFHTPYASWFSCVYIWITFLVCLLSREKDASAGEKVEIKHYLVLTSYT